MKTSIGRTAEPKSKHRGVVVIKRRLRCRKLRAGRQQSALKKAEPSKRATKLGWFSFLNRLLTTLRHRETDRSFAVEALVIAILVALSAWPIASLLAAMARLH